MAAPTGLLDTTITTIETNLRTVLATRQAAFLAARGRYFQGIRTHSIIPVDGAATAPDLTVHPTDQPQSWLDAGLTLPATVPVALEIHVYQGPQGWGYVVVITIRMVGGTETWQRTINVGPETWRTHGWQRILSGV